ncbi:MAG: exodeoxyribonuclease VII large subunit [Treponema sp.]|jgi:exodeoxyribonuclease VII large subunit|nr:exodeoxyribonuclease VII large subunit [Treponema sp.]
MKGGRILSVSRLTELIRLNLEGAFRGILLEGELSNCRPSSTGHLYFTLKDAGASISAVMFKNRLRFLTFEPRDGMLLQVRGSVSVYAQRGSYQIICEEMEQAGAGDILALLEKRKQQLAAAGLFDEARKKPLPRFPETVGVVSSPTGAAVRDILNILQRRAAGIRIIILPAPVQGAEAAPIIARRIEQANQWCLADALIVGRGGGSLEDLLPFSEEAVVRAIAGSTIPVVSAVGHEIDWALSDFAADLRAPTPSAAAELVSESRWEIRDAAQAIGRELREAVISRLDRARLLIKPFNLENLEYRFRTILQPRLVRFDDAKEELLTALGERIREYRRRLEIAYTTLETASPQAILERGFAVVSHGKTGRALRHAGDVQAGDPLHILLMEGTITAAAQSVRHGGENAAGDHRGRKHEEF